MERLVTSNLKLGIIAGGQLGKMLIHEASKWDISTVVLDMDENCPASGVASAFVKGNHLDFNTVYNFGQKVDVLTFELEDINLEALFKLKQEGAKVIPDPKALQLISDKGLQKDFYHQNNFPTSPYKLYDSKKEIMAAIKEKKITYPFVQKLRKGGYDGRGVAVIESQRDLPKLLMGKSVVEEKIDIERELSVIAARNGNDEVRCFPPVDMVFNREANLVEMLVCPAMVTQEQVKEMKLLTGRLIRELDIVGQLSVEFFLDKKGDLIINEVAPRTHNSGHHTIESIVTSQFEQQLRAILDLPLGSTKIKTPSVMINLLGEPNHKGPVIYEGLTECMKIEGVKIHLYGKKITRPFRKMGHLTILADTIEEAITKAKKVKKLIKVKSWK